MASENTEQPLAAGDTPASGPGVANPNPVRNNDNDNSDKTNDKTKDKTKDKTEDKTKGKTKDKTKGKTKGKTKDKTKGKERKKGKNDNDKNRVRKRKNHRSAQPAQQEDNRSAALRQIEMLGITVANLLQFDWVKGPEHPADGSTTAGKQSLLAKIRDRNDVVRRLLPRMPEPGGRYRVASVRIRKVGHKVDSKVQVDPHVSPSQDDLKRLSSQGLRNRHNRCYRIAVLQAFLHVPAFCDMLGSIHPDCDKGFLRCATCALQFFAHRYWSADSKADEIDDLLENLFYLLGLAKGNMASEEMSEYWDDKQMDALEFIRLLRPVLAGSVLEDPTPVEFDDYDDTFSVHGRARGRCECGYDNTTYPGNRTLGDTALAIDVNIDKPMRGMTFMQYLRRNVFVWDTEGKCPTCKTPGRRKRTLRLTILPRLFVFHLKRTLYKGPDQPIQKIMDHVDVDEHVSFREFMAEPDDLLHPDAVRHHMFRLEAIVAHGGQDTMAGHYVSRVRCPGTSRFRTIDDERLGASEDMVGMDDIRASKEPYARSKFQPYLLLFSQIEDF